MMVPEQRELEPLSLLIVEDELDFREFLEFQLEPLADELTIVGEASNAAEAIDRVQELVPDLVFLDLRLPMDSSDFAPDEARGLALIAQIRDSVPNTRILILSSFGEDMANERHRETVFAALQEGAHGYITKGDNFTGRELLDVGQRLVRGEAIYGPVIARLIRESFLRTPSDGLLDAQLTQREDEVLAALATRRTKQEISSEIGLTVKAVNAHASNVLVKVQRRTLIKALAAGVGALSLAGLGVPEMVIAASEGLVRDRTLGSVETDRASQELVAASAVLPQNRFDVVTLAMSRGMLECPKELKSCFCEGDLDILNGYDPPHYLLVSDNRDRDKIRAAGNQQGIPVNRLNNGYIAADQRAGAQQGANFADALIKDYQSIFPTGVPKWIFCNEISACLWSNQEKYRQYLIGFARRLALQWNKWVIIAAPIWNPGSGAHNDDWRALQVHAYIATEVYTSGHLSARTIISQGNPVGYCAQQYRNAALSFQQAGVPVNRLMLVEYFANTLADTKTPWGRWGVSAEDWHRVIKARAQAASSIDFAGHISYGWANNAMGESSSARRDFMRTYASQQPLK